MGDLHQAGGQGVQGLVDQAQKELLGLLVCSIVYSIMYVWYQYSI